jgi:putative SOS response-associated peptidase YedK
MCGRFSQAGNAFRIEMKGSDLQTLFDAVDPLPLSPRYNIAPGQMIATVRHEEDHRRHFRKLRWGLVPSWAKSLNEGFKHINARGETAYKLPSYRSAFAKRRCLIVADGFFEWEKKGKEKVPHYFRLQGGPPFGFAGLWERWEGDGSPIESCTIITTDANSMVGSFHNRMPVILPADGYAAWLDSTTPLPQLQSMLVPFPADQMETFVVSPVVNNARHDVPECVEPVEPAAPSPSLFDQV